MLNSSYSSYHNVVNIKMQIFVTRQAEITVIPMKTTKKKLEEKTQTKLFIYQQPNNTIPSVSIHFILYMHIHHPILNSYDNPFQRIK